MRVVFINLHANEFLVKTSSKMLFKQSVALKHRYFLDWLLSQPDIEVCSYINDKGFSLKDSSRLLRPFRFLESRYVLAQNKLGGKKIKILRHKSDIRSDDIVIGYRHVPSSLFGMASLNGLKVISMIHFHGEKSDADLISKAEPNLLINECDLSKFSEIYKRYYPLKVPFVVHPFVAAERFQRIKPFNERENRCFSTGTITYKHHSEFIEIYGDPCDQPIRKTVLDNKDTLEDLIACYNANYLENQEQKVIKPTDNRIVRFWKAWYNLRHVGHQKKYFSFDMVERFNNFKMCLIGEEILGIPGIGFVEGMCCGCAYIGRSYGYYEDLGMIAGVHYIGYDGTLEDLCRVIRYYQRPENQQALERIAENGYQFAINHFRKSSASQNLLDSLKDEINKRK